LKSELLIDKERGVWIETNRLFLSTISPAKNEARMEQELTLDDLRTIARQAGLKLTDEELQGLLPGVNRSKKQVAELRALISLESEPAGTFAAPNKNTSDITNRCQKTIFVS
jgi:hypothetical protein